MSGGIEAAPGPSSSLTVEDDEVSERTEPCLRRGQGGQRFLRHTIVHSMLDSLSLLPKIHGHTPKE